MPRGSPERTQFDRLYEHTKFGEIAQRIVEGNEGMRKAGIIVVRFTFLPEVGVFDESDESDVGEEGENFHFKITFGQLQSGT